MKNIAIGMFLTFLFLISCNMNNIEVNIEELKAEIVQTEQDFASMAKKEGVEKAFLKYAAEDAVLNRNNTVFEGKESIKAYFSEQTLKNVQLDWKPDFVDAAKSGDIGYTYGKYTFSAIDEKGDTIRSNGIFHTVWKKQADGKWLFVWD